MEIGSQNRLDVIVVGAGNAATCAALAAREAGAKVLMLEVAPEAARGGHSCFTGGAFRVVYHGVEDLALLIPDMNETELKDVDVVAHTEEQYFDGTGRLTQYRPDRPKYSSDAASRRRYGCARRGAVSARARTTGAPGRRAIQVLGRPRLSHLGRREGAVEGRELRSFTRRQRLPCCRGTLRRGRARSPSAGQNRWSSPAPGSRPMPRCGRAILAQLGPRQGPRVALQHRARAEDGARARCSPGPDN